MLKQCKYIILFICGILFSVPALAAEETAIYSNGILATEETAIYSNGILAAEETAIYSGSNIVGHADENGNVMDASGNIIGRADENGNVIDASGNIIGRVDETSDDIASDKKGEANSEDASPITNQGSGKCVPLSAKLVEGMDGSIIGYIGTGTKSDIRGKIDKNNNFIDTDGNIIGKVGSEWRDMVLDEKHNVIGYIDENGNTVGTNNNFLVFWPDVWDIDVVAIYRDCGPGLELPKNRDK